MESWLWGLQVADAYVGVQSDCCTQSNTISVWLQLGGFRQLLAYVDRHER
jgi:hypothetical protein